MSQIKFKNGNVYDTITVLSQSIKYMDQQRSSLNIQISEDKFDAIRNEIAISGNTDEIILIDDSGQYLYTNYSILESISVTSYETVPATDTTPAVMESRTSLMLAQLTYLEVTQAAQQAMIDVLTLTTLGV